MCCPAGRSWIPAPWFSKLRAVPWCPSLWSQSGNVWEAQSWVAASLTLTLFVCPPNGAGALFCKVTFTHRVAWALCAKSEVDVVCTEQLPVAEIPGVAASQGVFAPETTAVEAVSRIRNAPLPALVAFVTATCMVWASPWLQVGGCRTGNRRWHTVGG